VSTQDGPTPPEGTGAGGGAGVGAAGAADCGNRCGDTLTALEAYLDGELEPARLGDIRAHLSACYPCADRATFEEQLRALVRTGCLEPAPQRLRARIHDHLRGVASGQG
jgi:mycothiol system anti-sigma-R factor